MSTLTPEQKALQDLYVHRFTAMALNTVKEGKQDRTKTFEAMKQVYVICGRYGHIKHYVHYDPLTKKLLNDSPYGKAGDTLIIPTAKEGDWAAQRDDCLVIFTGTRDFLEGEVKRYTGQRDVKNLETLAWHHNHPAAYSLFCQEVLGMGGMEHITQTFMDYSANIGTTYQFDTCAFATDPPAFYFESLLSLIHI